MVRNMNAVIPAVIAAGAAAAAGTHCIRKKKAMAADGRGQTVLITGASGGIGRELARIFAGHHFDLVLVSRNEKKLESLKEELESRFGVKASVIPMDLAQEDAAKKIHEETERRGIEIDQLVNNAGAGKVGTVTDTDPDVMTDLIHMNITAVTLLCRLYGHDMAARGHGRILNVASITAYAANPYFNVYGPSKSYVLYLSETMRGELRGSGVTVTALCPGPTKTNWCANAGKKDSFNARRPEDVAEAAFAGMQMGSTVVIPGADCRAYRCIMPLLPGALQARIVGAWQKNLIQ